jgi:hypothetical protein
MEKANDIPLKIIAGGLRKKITRPHAKIIL